MRHNRWAHQIFHTPLRTAQELREKKYNLHNTEYGTLVTRVKKTKTVKLKFRITAMQSDMK